MKLEMASLWEKMKIMAKEEGKTVLRWTVYENVHWRKAAQVPKMKVSTVNLANVR